mgnify:CR=1 FL=1
METEGYEELFVFGHVFVYWILSYNPCEFN